MANPMKRDFASVYSALNDISKETGVDFGLGDYTPEAFKKKYFTGPGNINNLYNNLDAIAKEANIDFGLGTRDEWLESFGYKRDGNAFRTLDGRRVGSHDDTVRRVARTQQQPETSDAFQRTLQSPEVSKSAPGFEDHVLGTPWGSDGGATGKSNAYKPFTPGQVRETGDPGATQFGVPYKPDTQMTAAQRDEVRRQNDYAVRQANQLRREQQRRNQPVVDTGSKEANSSIVKTQGQWEDDLQKGASRISSSVVVPAVDKAIAEFDKKADEIWRKYNEQSRFVDSASPMSIAIGREANKAKDPEKILDFLKQQVEGIYKDSSFVDKIGKEADRMGIDRGEYLEKVIKPQIQSDLSSRLVDTLAKRELPKSATEYILNGLGNSIVGMLYNAVTETKGQREIKNQAEAMTESGQNPYYTPGTGSELAKMGVTFAADAPFFGVTGKVGGTVAKKFAERQIQNLMAKGLSEGAARSIVGTALENSVGARMKNYLMQHVVSSGITLGGFNALSESARQVRDSEFDPLRIAGSTAEGIATGAAFGLTGGVSQALTQPLSGISLVGAKIAGFGAEAETLYATEELSKMVQGEEGFTNPFEGSAEALMKLGVMKASSGHPLTKAVEIGAGIAKNGLKKGVSEALSAKHSGVGFSKEEEAYIRDTAEGRSLLEALSGMHPEIAVSEVNGKKRLTEEGETLRRKLADSYNAFMENPEYPATVKQKVAHVLGGIYRPGLETGADIVHNPDGSVILKTRDKDGNCIREMKFDTFSDAEAWRDEALDEFRLNDAVNMWNATTEEKRLAAVDEVADMYGLSREDAAKMVTSALDSRDTSLDRDQYSAVFGAVERNAYPADEYNPRQRYEEGRKMTAEERHFAQVDAQLAEEQLALLGQDFAEEVKGATQYADEKMAELATRKDVSKEQIEAARDYYNAMAKLSGMMDETLKNIDEQVDAANAQVQRNTHPDSGTLIEATYDGRNYYVTAGHIQVTPDGRLVPTDNSGMVILRDRDTGEIEVMNPDKLIVTAIADPRRLMAENDSMEGLRGRLMKQADDSIELAPGTPETPQEMGETFTGADGRTYMVAGVPDDTGNVVWMKQEVNIDENGLPEAVGELQPLDIDEYRKAKSDEIDAANRSETADTEAQTGDNIPQEEIQAIDNENIERADNADNQTPLEQELERRLQGGTSRQSGNLDNAGGEAGAEGTGADNPPATALSRIPVDEKGRQVYEQAKPEDTLAELTERYGEDKARQMIGRIAESNARSYDELLQKDTSGITDMADLAAHEDELAEAKRKTEYWKGISQTIEAEKAKKTWENLVNPKEIRNFATDPESQAKWVDEHMDEIVDSYIRTHGNILDPDKLRDALTSIGYNGKNVPDFKDQGKRLTKAVYDKMLQDAVASGNRSITLLTGAGGAGKSKATESMDFSGRGMVYDSAFNNVRSLDKAINQAKEAGMTDIQVVAVYNDAATSFSNTVERGLRTGRFLSMEYFVNEAFTENQGKIAELRELHPDVEIVCIDNSGNKSTERPDGGRVSADEAANWDYIVNDAKLNELLDIFENGINERRFTEDEAASIGRRLRDVTRSIPDLRVATEQRVSRIERSLREQDDGDILPDLPRGTSGMGGRNVVPAPDGEVQGSSPQRPAEGEPGTPGQTPAAEAPADGETGNRAAGTGKPGVSEDNEPAGSGAAVSADESRGSTAAHGDVPSDAQGEVRGGGNPADPAGVAALAQRPGVASGVADGRQSAGSGKPAVSPKLKKVYQNTVEANRGRTFTVTLGNGNRSVITVDYIDHNGDAVITRQDYDPQGNAIGEARKERHPFEMVGKAIVENVWKKDLTTEEQLRKVYKFKVGDVPVVDVLTEAEQQQVLDAINRGDKNEIGYLTSELIEQHRDDFILRGRDNRNERVRKGFARSGRGERLRSVRDQYKGFPEALTYLEDESMQPQTIEEYVAEALGDVPKMGDGFLAYTSYDQGGNTIVGLKDETGFGSRGFAGDTKGFNPWLAPKGKGISLKQFAEAIHEQLPEGLKEQYSDHDIRNVISNVLTGAEKPTDIANYILRNRTEQAEAMARHTEESWMDAPNFQKAIEEHYNARDHMVERDFGSFESALKNLDEREISIDDPELLKAYGLKNVVLSRLGDHLTLTHFIASEQGKGNGTRFMNDLARLADQKGWTLALTPDDSFGATSTKRLKDFYKRFGFKENRGRNADFGTRESMVRRPKDYQPESPERQEENLRNAVVNHLRESGIDVSDDWKLGQKILDDYNRRTTAEEYDEEPKAQKVSDQQTLDELSNGKTVKRYRAMQLIDGKLYPPMSAKVDGEMREPTEIGVWEQSEERPDLIKNGKFVLNKGQKGQGNVPAAYNPYFHTSTSGLNDQFTSAYKRPELVVVEVEIPESELTSGYKAEGAKDAVGNVDWHSGVVNGQLPADRQRQVTLSRYSKVNRIVPDSEVADMIAKQLEGTDVEVPYNVVTPQLRKELENRGVKISERPAGSVTEDINGNPIRQQKAMVVELPQAQLKRLRDEYQKLDDMMRDDQGRDLEQQEEDLRQRWLREHGTNGIGEAMSNWTKELIAKYGEEAIERRWDLQDEIKELESLSSAKFFKTSDGQAYGYTYQGKIYIDPRIATAETPIHEYGHLWAEMKRQTAPDEWEQMKKVMLTDKLVQPIIDRVKRDYPELAKEGREDDFIEEIITQFSGKRGAERLREVAEEVARENGGVFGKAEAVTAMQRLKNILNRFWEGVARMMGWKYTNANQIADRMMADMLNGVNPREEIKKTRVNRSELLKQRQLDLILKENPADDKNMPGHTWIRSVEDINTFREALEYDGYGTDEDITPDFTADMAKDALNNGVVTVYSSKPIKDGTFVTPSKMEAQNYAGNDKVYSKEVPLTDVAWIDAIQGQYAKVSEQVKNQKMDYASNEEKQRTETIINAVKKLFGTTYDIRETGYVLPDGTMPDFSGRHLMNPGSDTSFLRGRRTVDHREVESIAYERDGNTRTGIETDMPDFIRRGAIRIDDNAGNINLSTKPTDKQKEVLRRLIARNDGYVQVDFGDGWDSNHYVEYDGAKPSKVLADIDRYFDEGIKPQSEPKYQLVGKKGAAEADKAEGTTMRQDNLKVAEDMEKGGKDAKAIKFATGWERGKDGKWRYETVDADVDVLTPYYKKYEDLKGGRAVNPEPILKLKDLLGEDNELFKYYPDLKDIQVLFSNSMNPGTAGSTDGKTIELNAKEVNRFGDRELDNENVYGTLLHEVQHIIQEKEGFAQGGSLSTATTEAGMEAIMQKKEMERDRVLQEIKSDEMYLSSDENLSFAAQLDGRSVEDERKHLKERLEENAAKYDNLTAQIDRIYNLKTVSMSDARNLYHNLAGEVEARNVTERMGMSETERRHLPASGTEDVARRDQVIIMGDGTSMNINDIKPVGTGDFGDIYDQFRRKPKEAVDFLVKKKGGDLLGVFHRDEVGDIDLIWGSSPNPHKGKGLAHIIRKHIETLNDFKDTDELASVLDDVVNNGNLSQNGNNIELTKDGYRVVLAQEKNGKKWVLTAFDNNKTKKEKLSSANTAGTPIDTSDGRAVATDDNFSKQETSPKGTLTTPPLNPEADGVTLPSSDVLSEGKDTKNINTLQENGQENAGEEPKMQRASYPEPEMTPEERQYWKKWDAAMKKWKERNAIAADADGPGEKPQFRQGESALDFAKRLVDYKRAEKIWQTAPKLEDYRQARDDKVIADDAHEAELYHGDLFRNDGKARRIAADLQRIRHAMSRQKAYDKATVKAVTDFAQDFMQLGFGDHMGRGDLQRMLSSVKNATGAKDVRQNIDNIMNILIDNHLRNLDQQIVKLSSVKELRQTAQGVEAQGRLELKGQRMIQAFREAREGRMDAEKIREELYNVAEKMARNDEEAPMWEQDYEGLSLALQYQENIEASRDEYAEIERQYKDAVMDYKGSGRSYKDQQQLLESLNQAMMENKIERIGMFGDIIGRLQGNISESMKGAREFVERDKERIKRIYQLVNFDTEGKEPKTHRKEDRTDRLLKNDMVQLAFAPLGTFEQMLKQFGSRNVKGEGYLYNYYMRGYIDAIDNAYKGEVKVREELDAKAKEVFGVKRWTDLYDISTKPGKDVTFLDGDKKVTENLSQGNMLYIYMAEKMSDGKMKLRKMGITEEDVDAIKEALDPRLVQLADWLQSEYLPQKRSEYNKVHERMFGAPMAAIENYFPIKVNRDAAYQDAEKYITTDDGDKLPSSITGSIIKRTRNKLPLDILHTDALNLAMEHLNEMERWKAQAEWNRDVKDLLSYTTFRNKVKNMKTVYGSGTPLWNKFFDAATIATGDYKPKRGVADKAITNIAKGVTSAKINFRIYTAFKQLLSLPAFFTDVSTTDMAKALMPQNYFYNNFKWAMKNMPVFKKRWESRKIGDTRLMDDPTDWKLWKKKWMQNIQRGGMFANASVDALTCAAGAKAIYETRYKKYKEMGASDEVARKRALQDAEIGYNLTQQSSEGAFVSAIQKDRTVAANALSVFRNGPFAYGRQAFDAMRNMHKMLQKGYEEDSIKFMTRQFQDELGLDENQAKRAAGLNYAKAFRHELAKMLNMMLGVTALWNMGASLPYLIFGDDDKTRKEMLIDAIAKGLAGGPAEGLAGGNIWSDIMGRALSEKTRQKFWNEGFGSAFDDALKQAGDYEVNPLPLMADIQSMIEKLGYDKYAALQDIFNIAAQSYTGVNPQTITDIWNAAVDYGAMDWMPGVDAGKHNTDLSNAKEIALFIMRVLNAPTSSWRNKYIDELGMNAEDAKKLPYDEMARRYAHYKHWKDAPIMGWLRSDEARQEKMDKIRKQFDKAVKERLNRLDYEYLREELDNTDDETEKKAIVGAMKEQTKALTNRQLLEQQGKSDSQEERKMLTGVIKERAKEGVDKLSDEALRDSTNNTKSMDRKNAFIKEYAKRQGTQDYYGRADANETYKDMRTFEDAKEDIMLSDLYSKNKGKLDEKTLKKVNKLKSKVSKQRSALGNSDGSDTESDMEKMRDLREWRREAIEILLKAEAENSSKQ